MTIYAGEVWGKRNPPALLMKMQVCITPLDVSVAISQKIRTHLLQDPVIPHWDIYPKDTQLCHKDMYTTMFIASLFVIARTWKQPKFPFTEEWIRKIWYIYTMEYYTAGKNNDTLILSEITEKQKDNYDIYSLMSVF